MSKRIASFTKFKWNPCSIRIPSKNKRSIEKPNLKELFHYIQQSKPAPSIPQIARQFFHTKPTHPIAIKRSIAHPPFSPPLEASRYSLPATEQWNHSIYTYDKQTTKPLPATSLNAKKLLNAYFNMIPRGFNDVLGKFADRKYLRRSCFRAFISDRATGMQPVKAELMGKICRSGRHSFHIPFRRLCAAQPNVVFRHYPGGVTSIMMFVYDRRLETLRQRLRKCRLELLRGDIEQV